ncbi:MAG: ABC transporter ATP-binding protein [Sedimentisphaerales bacterium]|nr:ABC transporter ATP-binding protein [Sedimentisphaerales bacterium]
MIEDKTKRSSQESSFILELNEVTKTFYSDSGEKIRALEGLNLHVTEGEFITLVGATGCGKTTLLNMIAGLETPDDGQLCLGRNLVLGDNIAYVFQHYTLFPWRSTLSNVSFGLQMRGIGRKKRKDKAMQFLSKVGLEGFENTYPYELSGGMRQRAAIAQALAIKPKLLLMDEPFGALDDSTRRELQQMLTELWQDNRTTILFVTHNIDEAVLLGDKVLVLSERPGRIVREFNVVLPRPRNSLTKEFTDLFMRIRQSLSAQLD